MRVGEALRLGRGDIDWDTAVIQVRGTKFNKGRDVPVSESTIAALAGYARQRDRRCPVTARLFVSLAGTPVAYSHFSATFRGAVTAAGIGAGTAIRPRIHDLRHSFAVRTLLGWHRAGLDAEALLPRLSTYLGHREPRFTYRYLTATPTARPGRRPAGNLPGGDPVSPVAPTLQAFFTDRLIRQRQVSARTVESYRDTLRLLLGYVQATAGKQPAELTWTTSATRSSPPSSTTSKPGAATRRGPVTCG